MEINSRKNTIIFFTINSKRYKAKIVGYDKPNNIIYLYIFNTNKVIKFKAKQTEKNKPLGDITPSEMAPHTGELNPPVGKNDTNQTTIKSPLSGRVIKIHGTKENFVPANAPLVTIESMKMENEIRAPFDLFIKSIHIDEGHLVQKDQVLLQIESVKSKIIPPTEGNK